MKFNKNEIKLAIFDLDGTLIDSSERMYKLFCELIPQTNLTKEEYWNLCSKSISDYKIQYDDTCAQCYVKEICGGVFGSTKRMINFVGEPITK